MIKDTIQLHPREFEPSTLEVGGASFNVEVLTPQQFAQRNLPNLRTLSYAQYRKDQSLQPVLPAKPTSELSKTYYIVASNNDLITDCCPRRYPPSTGPSLEIQQKAQTQFPTTAGFYKIEFGFVQPTGDALSIPVEADALIDWNGWQSCEYVGYISTLSFNPLTHLKARADITTAIHTKGSEIANKLNGGLNRILAIMSPNVAGFVKRIGVDMQPLGGSLRWRDESGNLTKVAQRVFLEYPGYWGTENTPSTERPILWQVSKGFPHRKVI